MTNGGGGVGYRIWGVDNVVYGPVELPELVRWTRDGRVTAGAWVFCEQDDAWQRASQVPELRMFFKQKEEAPPGSGVTSATAAPTTGEPRIKPGSLRRVKVFAHMTDEQLERFIQFMEFVRVTQWTQLVQQGDHGDAMYLVLEGELRVRLMVGGKESLLVTLSPGEYFGEMSLFDRGPRSADVVANTDSLLLKISSASFEKLLNDAPNLAAPFLFALSKTLTSRIRADNRRYRDSIQSARAASK